MPHRYGGPWTELKLDVLKKYLNFYTDALKNQRFEKWYIDAFAGSGERHETRIGEPDMFSAGGTEEQSFDGSAKIALQLTKPFDRYYFIEDDEERHNELQLLATKYPTHKIKCLRGNANSVLPEIIKDLKLKSRRAVAFLDPYGLNLDWSTLVSLAQTERVDVAYLIGIAGIVRQAAHDRSKIETFKIERLNKMFGDANWLNELYRTPEKEQYTLPGLELGDQSKRCSPKEVEKWVEGKLLSAGFKAVSKPLRLPPTGTHKFSLFFAASNKLGAPIAVRAANHIIGKEGN